ncbi:MAG: hypothetical protein J6U97_03655 [Bacteroidaceae bacterium]|nr:hypothetical protein [Bacteroidaceae bacterium]
MKRLIALILLCVPALFAKAQDLTNAQERYMKMDVLYLMEDYSLYSNLVLEEDMEGFMQLFSDTTTQIYNDLLGISSAKTLSVRQYAEKLIEGAGGSSNIKVKNIGHDEPYYSEGLWYMNVTFDKWLYYMIKCDLQLDSYEYFQADHKLTALVSWDPSTRECRIETLDGTVDSPRELLPEDYWVYRFETATDTIIQYDGAPLQFDRFGQSFILKDKMPENLSRSKSKKTTPLTLTQKHFTYPLDSDVNLKLDYADESCNLITMSLIPKRWRFKVHADMVYGDYYTVETNYDDMEHTSSAKEAGAEFGYVFPSRKKSKWAFFFGATLRQSILSSYIDNMSYIYKTNQDVDGDEYYRAYYLKNVNYSMEKTEIGIPLYFSWDGKFNNRLSMYMDFGVKPYLSILPVATTFSTIYTTKGLYTKYDKLVLGSTSGINGFVQNKTFESVSLESESTYEAPEDIFTKLQPSVDAFAGVGFRLRVLKNTFLELGCRYQYNIYSSLNYSGTINTKRLPVNTSLQNISYQNYTTNSSSVPMYYTKQGSKENVRQYTDYFTSIRTDALYLNAGIIIRY